MMGYKPFGFGGFDRWLLSSHQHLRFSCQTSSFGCQTSSFIMRALFTTIKFLKLLIVVEDRSGVIKGSIYLVMMNKFHERFPYIRYQWFACNWALLASKVGRPILTDSSLLYCTVKQYLKLHLWVSDDHLKNILVSSSLTILHLRKTKHKNESQLQPPTVLRTSSSKWNFSSLSSPRWPACIR